MSVGRIFRDAAQAVLHGATHSKRIRGLTDNLHSHFGDIKTKVDGLDVYDGKPDLPGKPGQGPSSTPYRPDLSRKPDTMSDEDYFRILESSVHNPNGPDAVLGKFKVPGTDSYIAVAEAGNPPSTYFSLGDDWGTIADAHGLSDSDMFDAFNVPFLDRMMSEGKDIRFSHDPNDFPGSALADELEFLEKHGYRFDPDSMRAVLRDAGEE